VTPDEVNAPGSYEGAWRRLSPAAAGRARPVALLRALMSDPVTATSLVFVLVVICSAAFAPLLAPYSPDKQDYLNVLAGPSWAHPFGTDQIGRDLLSRILFGARTSLVIGFSAVVLALAAGTVVGIAGGYFGGWLDTVFMRSVDLILAFPLLIFAILMVVVLGPSLENVILAVAASQFPVFARLARSLTLAERSKEYVEAAHATGAGDFRILTKHIWPNVMPGIYVQGSSTIGVAILSGAALSFLGIGVQPPTADWGRMVAEFAPSIYTHPWLAFYPGLAIGLTALAWNLLGDGVLAFVDPGTDRGVL
jgi:peptide/nickel transport system permease protein